MAYKINKYPDGASYVSIPKEWENTIQEIVFRVNTYEDLVHLCQLCDVLVYNRVKANITIPCLLDAQADKRFNEFHSSGLVVLARILDDYCDGENLSLSVFHPHNPEVLEALFTSVEIVDNSDFIFNILNSNFQWGAQLEHINNPKWENLILMSSDAGGFKPLMKLCDKINWMGETYSATKARAYKNNSTQLEQFIDREDFKGKDILIVDDISVYGGTFKGLSVMLRQRNVGKLYLAVSHMTIQNLGDDPVTNYFDRVFTTNSKFDSYYHTESQGYDKINGITPENLEIIKLFKNQTT